MCRCVSDEEKKWFIILTPDDDPLVLVGGREAVSGWLPSHRDDARVVLA
jgi:hypothetical protein